MRLCACSSAEICARKSLSARVSVGVSLRVYMTDKGRECVCVRANVCVCMAERARERETKETEEYVQRVREYLRQ